MTNFTLTSTGQRQNETQDPFFYLLRSGAKKLIAQAVDAELQLLLDQYKDIRLLDVKAIASLTAVTFQLTTNCRSISINQTSDHLL